MDNIAKALDRMRHGVRWCPVRKVMLWSLDWETEDRDSQLDPEVMTMREVSKMASSIIKALKFTYY